MNSPICVTNTFVTNKKRTTSFRIVSLLLAIAPLWLMLATANTSAATPIMFRTQTTHSLTRGLDAVPPRQHAALESL